MAGCYAAFWDDKAGTRVMNNSIDICVAVATEKVGCVYACWDCMGGLHCGFQVGERLYLSGHLSADGALQFYLQGLMTPILKNADQKSLTDISSEVILSGMWCCD
jgi:pyruvate/2-oxoglutarate dehydrogenase complex dihydrolipoamide acyltransferase (E2) component